LRLFCRAKVPFMNFFLNSRYLLLILLIKTGIKVAWGGGIVAGGRRF
jgi:hypothetical protein